MTFTLAKRKAIVKQYLGAPGEQIEQLTQCKDKCYVAKKLISFSDVLSSTCLSEEADSPSLGVLLCG